LDIVAYPWLRGIIVLICLVSDAWPHQLLPNYNFINFNDYCKLRPPFWPKKASKRPFGTSMEVFIGCTHEIIEFAYFLSSFWHFWPKRSTKVCAQTFVHCSVHSCMKSLKFVPFSRLFALFGSKRPKRHTNLCAQRFVHRSVHCAAPCSVHWTNEIKQRFVATEFTPTPPVTL